MHCVALYSVRWDAVTCSGCCVMLCCALQEVHRSLSTLLPRLPGPAAAALAPHLEALHNTAIDIGAGCAVCSCGLFSMFRERGEAPLTGWPCTTQA